MLKQVQHDIGGTFHYDTEGSTDQKKRFAEDPESSSG
jgi:hypothetical protein